MWDILKNVYFGKLQICLEDLSVDGLKNIKLWAGKKVGLAKFKTTYIYISKSVDPRATHFFTQGKEKNIKEAWHNS